MKADDISAAIYEYKSQNLRDPYLLTLHPDDLDQIRKEVGILPGAMPISIYGINSAVSDRVLRGEILFDKNLASLPALPHDLVAEPVLGWRCWAVLEPQSLQVDRSNAKEFVRLVREGRTERDLFAAKLAGVGYSSFWSLTPVQAICNQNTSHEAPHRDCQCGIWALKDEATMREQLAHYASQYSGRMAYGQVQLWGRVFEHQRGFRGQYAKPVSLTVVGCDPETVEALGAFYGCEAIAGEPLPNTETIEVTALGSTTRTFIPSFPPGTVFSGGQVTMTVTPYAPSNPYSTFATSLAASSAPIFFPPEEPRRRLWRDLWRWFNSVSAVGNYALFFFIGHGISLLAATVSSLAALLLWCLP